MQFMTFADLDTPDPLGLVQVKNMLPASNMILTDPSEGNPMWTFLSELMRAVRDRGGGDDDGGRKMRLWGALCNETCGTLPAYRGV